MQRQLCFGAADVGAAACSPVPSSRVQPGVPPEFGAVAKHCAVAKHGAVRVPCVSCRMHPVESPKALIKHTVLRCIWPGLGAGVQVRIAKVVQGGFLGIIG